MAALALVLDVCVCVFGKIELSFVIFQPFSFSHVFLFTLISRVV